MKFAGGFIKQYMILSVINSPTAKNKVNSINHCSTNCFKSINIDVKFKQLHIGVRL